METTTPQLTRSAIIALLEQHGIMPTPQRIEIAQILLAQPQHLSAEQVLARVNRDQAVVSKATVYNTLGLFARKGLVRELVVDPNKIFYDPTTTHHHHFYNVEDGTLMDLEASAVTLDTLPTPPPGTCIDGVDVIIRLRKQP